MDQKLWIVVANASCVRVFNCKTIHKFEEIRTFVHPESRLHERDLKSDRSGSTLESYRSGYSSLAQPSSQKEVELEIFSKEVAEFLADAQSHGEVERIHLASSPSFLGALRHSLNGQVNAIVDKTVTKDLTHLKPEALTPYFFPV